MSTLLLNTHQPASRKPTNLHQCTKQPSRKKLYVSDSLVKLVDARRVECKLDGRLDAPVAGQYMGGHPGSAYTNLPGSKGAKYKEANLKQRLQHLILDGFS